MKFFEVPEINVLRFAVEDVITTSGEIEDGTGDNQTPPAVRP